MKNAIQVQSIASTKSGEGRDWLIMGVGIILLSLVAALVLMLGAISTSTRDAVLDQQNEYGLYNSPVIRGLFSIVSVRFSGGENASCAKAESFRLPVSVTVRFRAYEVPESCSFFVNQVLTQTVKKLSAQCVAACSFDDFNRQFSLGEMDYRDAHTIRVCCDKICIDKTLESLCNQ